MKIIIRNDSNAPLQNILIDETLVSSLSRKIANFQTSNKDKHQCSCFEYNDIRYYLRRGLLFIKLLRCLAIPPWRDNTTVTRFFYAP
ncbi:MAG: hypothetical protein ACRCZB_01950 [Bacteroidales bacterium]